MLTGSDDNTAKLWNLSGQSLITFSGHTASVKSVAFSPDGAQVLTGSDDNTARLWIAGTGQVLKSFAGHKSGVLSVAFSPDGKSILTGSQDGTAKLWNIDTDCLECRAYQFSLLELWEAGVQLEPEDLKKIGKDKNKGQE